MKFLRRMSMVLFSVLFITMVYAEDMSNEFALGGRLGTLGLGVELYYDLNPTFNVRLGLNDYSWDYDSTESDVEYEIELSLSSYELFFDYYPFQGVFHLTCGFLNNKNELSMNGKILPGETVEIGNINYTAEQVGILSGSIDFKSFAPYLGIGLGNPVSDGHLHFIFDLGIVLQGKPSVNLSSRGGILSDNSYFLSELNKEKIELEDDLSGFKYYPVISIGLSYKF